MEGGGVGDSKITQSSYGDDIRPIKRIMPLSSSCIMNRKGWSATKGAEGAGPD